MTTLLLTGRFGKDDQALWQAAIGRGWKCERLRGPRIPEIDDSEIVVYAESFYAPLIERALGIQLLEPPEDWLASLPACYQQRSIRLLSLEAARCLHEPLFIKPLNAAKPQWCVKAKMAFVRQNG
jgi:hypothetical protein